MNKILGFGELMLRLTPSKHYDLISETNDFSASFGGAEANVIIDLASRGHNCEFLTAFPENEIGKKAISYLKNYGVDTSNILFDNERLGKYYIEHGFSTRSSNIIYDRKNSSFSKLTIENSKLERFFEHSLVGEGFHFYLKYLLVGFHFSFGKIGISHLSKTRS